MMFARTALLIFALASLSVHAKRINVEHITPELSHSTFSTQEIPSNSFGATSSDPKATALAFAAKTFGLSPKDYIVTSAYTSENVGVTHVYLRQIYKGLEVLNGDMNINVDRHGNILSYGNSFFPAAATQDVKAWSSSSSGFVTPSKAFNTLTNYLKLQAPTNIKEKSFNGLNGNPKYELDGVPFAKENVKAEQAYVQLSDSKLVPTWKFNVRMTDNWFDACVHADGSKVVFLNDWVSEFTYKAVPINKNSPVDGVVSIKDPENKITSPLGWTQESETAAESGGTKGNNVYAQQNIDDSSDPTTHSRPAHNKDGVFDFSIDLTKEPSTYTDAATVNLFYVCNSIHDIFYKNGFDEAAGNFQVNNFNKGGKGGDQVIANAQDGSGTNNANFATPPDGQNGEMRMYVFDMTSPNRDGDLENGIIAHEHTHGLSNRLTGGPANSNCLPSGQAGGMGEGWSDTVAFLLQMNEKSRPENDVVMGSYVLNDPKGIRTYPYSTDSKRNPTTYTYVSKSGWSEVHKTGEVWANILFNVYWAIAAQLKYKFNADWFSLDKSAVNTLFLQILIQGMKLQPCKPTFLTARDAIIKATDLFNRDVTCAVWRAFAQKGLGPAAKMTGTKVTEDYKTPSTCLKK